MMFEMAIRAIERCSRGLASLLTIDSKLSKQFMLSIPVTTALIADRFNIVIKIAKSDTSVWMVVLDLKRRILIIDFMHRSEMNWNLKCSLLDTLASRIEIYSLMNGSGWLSRLNMPMILSTSYCCKIKSSLRGELLKLASFWLSPSIEFSIRFC